MSNEEIVSEIRAGRSVSENMEILYTRNLPLIKKFIKPCGKRYSIMKRLKMYGL